MMKKRLMYFALAATMLAAAGCSKDDDEFGIPNNVKSAFPDPIFRTYVLENFDTDGDGKISEEEALAVIKISVTNSGKPASEKIASLKGIEYFTNLTSLSCAFSQLTSLDVSQNTKLEVLYCYGNELTSLDVSGCTALTYLECSSNQLTSLDISQNTALTSLSCYNNLLTTLDVSRNTALTLLGCNDNQLTSLDVSRNTALTDLRCWRNQLTSLDVSQNTALRYLSCESNQLTSLDVSKTNLGNGEYGNPLHCSMSTLETLILKKGWEIKGVNVDRSTDYISENTIIEYVD